jgi:hypothetical protein
LEKSLIAYLLAFPALQFLVSSRINWLVKPQGAINPYIVMQVISGVREANYQTHDALSQTRVQVDCWGLTFASAKSVGDAVQLRLLGFRGAHIGTYFDGIFLDSERHGYDASQTPDKLYRVSIDLMIWHKGA